MIDNYNINNLAKNQVSAIFHSHAIRRSVLPKFTELCMETSCWCPSGWAPTWRLDLWKWFATDSCYFSPDVSATA